MPFPGCIPVVKDYRQLKAQTRSALTARGFLPQDTPGKRKWWKLGSTPDVQDIEEKDIHLEEMERVENGSEECLLPSHGPSHPRKLQKYRYRYRETPDNIKGFKQRLKSLCKLDRIDIEQERSKELLKRRISLPIAIDSPPMDDWFQPRPARKPPRPQGDKTPTNLSVISDNFSRDVSALGWYTPPMSPVPSVNGDGLGSRESIDTQILYTQSPETFWKLVGPKCERPTTPVSVKPLSLNQRIRSERWQNRLQLQEEERRIEAIDSRLRDDSADPTLHGELSDEVRFYEAGKIMRWGNSRHTGRTPVEPTIKEEEFSKPLMGANAKRRRLSNLGPEEGKLPEFEATESPTGKPVYSWWMLEYLRSCVAAAIGESTPGPTGAEQPAVEE